MGDPLHLGKSHLQVAIGDDEKEEQQKDETEMGHEKVEARGVDRTLLFDFGQDQLPAGQTHQLPKEQEHQGVAGRDDTEHREDKGEVMDKVVPFAFDMWQITE